MAAAQGSVGWVRDGNSHVALPGVATGGGTGCEGGTVPPSPPPFFLTRTRRSRCADVAADGGWVAVAATAKRRRRLLCGGGCMGGGVRGRAVHASGFSLLRVEKTLQPPCPSTTHHARDALVRSSHPESYKGPPSDSPARATPGRPLAPGSSGRSTGGGWPLMSVEVRSNAMSVERLLPRRR